jgi:group I intron endonuclease
METYGYIYITENKINGKRYIGKHKSKNFDIKYFGSGVYLTRAIKKYGKKNFTCFPLSWAWSKEELNQLEIDYIAHYKPEYNIAKGGEGGGMSGKKLSEESKQKMSESHKGKKRKPFTEETRKRMSEKMKGKISNMYGKHHSDKTKKKISDSEKQYYMNRRVI